MKASLASPTFTGIPNAPTAAANANSTQIATTEFVKTAVANLVSGAPAALDTLNELAAALGSDASFSTTVSTSLGLKAPINNPTFTGTVGGITKSMVGLGSVDNTSDTSKPISTATQNALDLKASISYVDLSLNLKPSFSQVDASLNLKSSISYVDSSLNLKSSISYVDSSLNLKSSISYVDSSLNLKSSISYVDASLNLKSSISYVDASLNLKPRFSQVDASLNLKPSFSQVDASLNLKSNITYVDASLNLKPLFSQVDSSLNLKPSFSQVDASLNLKPSFSQVDSSLNLKPSFSQVDASLNLKSNITYVDASLNLKPSFSQVDASLNLKSNITYVDASLNLKANLAGPTFTGTVTAPKLTSGDASFNGNVDISGVLSVTSTLNSVVKNTTVNNYNVNVTNDLSLNGKLLVSSDVSFNSKLYVKSDASFNGRVDICGNFYAQYPSASIPSSAIIGGVTQSYVDSSLNLKANLANPTFTGTVGGITKSMVGLGSVDNTSDTSKPISTATQSALDLKSSITDVDASLNLKANLANPTFTGTVGGITKSMVGLGSVDNTADTSKPISTATQSALDLKSSITYVDASLNLKPRFSQVDASLNLKPSFSQVDASLNLKANLASPIFTGTITLPKITSGDASFNGNVDISGVLSVTSTLNTSVKNTTINNYNVAVTNDLSLNGNLLVSSDVSLNGKLYVKGVASFNGNVGISGEYLRFANSYLRNNATNSRLEYNVNSGYSHSLRINDVEKLSITDDGNGSRIKLPLSSIREYTPWSQLQFDTDAGYTYAFNIGGVVQVGIDSGYGFTLEQDLNMKPNKKVSWNYGGSEAYITKNTTALTLENAVATGYKHTWLVNNVEGMSLGSKLNVGLDASFNGKLGVGNDVSFNSKLYVGRDASFNGRVDICGNFFAQYPANSIPSSAIIGGGTGGGSSATDISVNTLTVGRGPGNVATNSAYGYQTLLSNTTGANNTAIGYQAGDTNTTGSNNTFLGSGSDTTNTWSNSTAIGANALITASNQIVLGTSMEMINVPGKLSINRDASFNSRVDICGNFYAQYPAASIPISAINGSLGSSSPSFAQVDASLNLKSNLASPTFTGIVTLPKVISGDASFNGRVDISGVLSVTQTTNSVVTNTTINNYNVIVTNDISLNGNIKASGKITAASFSSSSDYRIKSNILPLSDCSFEIGALNPVTFHNKITNKDDIGFIAHELQSHFPFLVTGEKDGDAIQTVNYTGIIGLLVYELQQLKKNVMPQTDLIYRGSVQLTNGFAYVNLDNRFNMPEGTFAAFKDVVVFTSNETGWDPVRGNISGNILTIECNVENANTTVSYLIAAKPK